MAVCSNPDCICNKSKEEPECSLCNHPLVMHLSRALTGKGEFGYECECGCVR